MVDVSAFAPVVVEIARLDVKPGETLLLKIHGQYARQAVPKSCKVLVVDDHIDVSKITAT